MNSVMPMRGKDVIFSRAVSRYDYQAALDVAMKAGTVAEIAIMLGCTVKNYYLLMEKDAAFATSMKQARAKGYEWRAETMLTLRQDNPTVDIKELELEFKITQWFLSKMHASVFGDKLALTVEAVDVSGAMNDARSRIATIVNPLCRAIEDAQIEEVDPFS